MWILHLISIRTKIRQLEKRRNIYHISQRYVTYYFNLHRYKLLNTNLHFAMTNLVTLTHLYLRNKPTKVNMNTYILPNLRLLISLCALLAFSSHAQSKWSVGLGAISVESPYLDTDNTTIALPTIDYYGENLTVRGIAADYKLFKKEGFSWSVILEPGQFFDSTDSDNVAISSLDERKLSLYAGTRIMHRSRFGIIRASVSHDVLGHGNSAKLNSHYSYPIKLSTRLSLTPFIGIELSSRTLSNYYYGVAQGESNTFDAYELGSTVNYQSGIVANYQLNKQWNINAMLKYSQLDDDIKNSPIVADNNLSTAMLSVSYHF